MSSDVVGSAGADAEVRAAVAAVRARIAAACARVGRSPGEVRLVAASKTQPPEAIRRALEAGVTDFAENYTKELTRKAPAVPGARWHFIGRLQTGTVRHVADLAAVVHTLEPGEALERLARRAASKGRVVDGLIQVDETGSRQGVGPAEVAGFARALRGLGSIRLVGLMAMPPPTRDPEGARPHFARLRALRDRLREEHPDLRELSMGMSADFEIAVEEGATMVRVGTALFGERPAPGGGAGGGASGSVGERP